MNETPHTLTQPPVYRVWDPKWGSFFYTDAQPEASAWVDRWTGLFDKQSTPLYENDIIRVHYDWKLGWVRALITRHSHKNQYVGQATAPDGSSLYIGFYSFADGYKLGNYHEHSGKLVRAKEQFAPASEEPWWASAIFRPAARSCFN